VPLDDEQPTTDGLARRRGPRGDALDTFTFVDSLPQPGAPAVASEFRAGPGGKGANQAVAAAKLAGNVTLIGRAGADQERDQVLEGVRRAGVDTRFVARDEGPTGRAVGVAAEGSESISAAWPGANAEVSPDDVAVARDSIARADIVLSQLEVPMAAVEPALEIAAANGATVLLDASPPTHLPGTLLGLVDVLAVNSLEARFFTGIEPSDRVSAVMAARRLLALGPGLVCVSAGRAGDLVASAHGHAWCHLPPSTSSTPPAPATAFTPPSRWSSQWGPLPPGRLPSRPRQVPWR